MKIWYDITNTPQVHFLLAIDRIIREISLDVQSDYTAREFSETSKMLARVLGEGNFRTIGKHYGKSYLKKVSGLFARFGELSRLDLEYDVSISCGSEGAIWKSFLDRKFSIAFGDNDQARQWTYSPFVKYAFFPKAIDYSILKRQGLGRKLYQYNGVKEDIYLSFYNPDKTFLESLPFDHYVVVRPENVMANYIRNGRVQSITPLLLKELDKAGYNILYLPRYDIDMSYSSGIKNIFIPDHPLNGLDACYYSDAVLTGAGTFAREAACMGVPSFSFYSGKQLLAVDRDLIKQGKMFFSRQVHELIARLKASKRTYSDMSRCLAVKEEVALKLKELLF